ncbi:hypothetical protein PCC8801_0581 [Rippkaea orientalis PCC 8801]|uniref:Molecular chaperone DnaJ n=1 Tax=Rippkaea orientalis (strain PCC 8801 / RF-1) TaxID=41431 RepID=B7JVU9_RIPO1|nr:hypothetical protein [Rippkaea orientalis]ACK64670.1 hypothetical protein PCC8801_0581 [Rippkaea orientalis PCC 8801]
MNHQSSTLKTSNLICHHCEGKGYSVIRDCTGEIQREETCLFCCGTGKKQDDEPED